MYTDEKNKSKEKGVRISAPPPSRSARGAAVQPHPERAQKKAHGSTRALVRARGAGTGLCSPRQMTLVLPQMSSTKHTRRASW